MDKYVWTIIKLHTFNKNNIRYIKQNKIIIQQWFIERNFYHLSGNFFTFLGYIKIMLSMYIKLRNYEYFVYT